MYRLAGDAVGEAQRSTARGFEQLAPRAERVGARDDPVMIAEDAAHRERLEPLCGAVGEHYQLAYRDGLFLVCVRTP